MYGDCGSGRRTFETVTTLRRSEAVYIHSEVPEFTGRSSLPEHGLACSNDVGTLCPEHSIVVGYDTEALAKLGYEMRSVTYSILPPSYEPTKDAIIRLRLIDREHMEQNARAGKAGNGYRILCDVGLAEFCGDWKSLSRLLFVKGASWEYEREVRLLVDLQQTRDTGEKDENGWPIKVIDPPRKP